MYEVKCPSRVSIVNMSLQADSFHKQQIPASCCNHEG